jgi:hypothetical protein
MASERSVDRAQRTEEVDHRQRLLIAFQSVLLTELKRGSLFVHLIQDLLSGSHFGGRGDWFCRSLMTFVEVGLLISPQRLRASLA